MQDRAAMEKARIVAERKSKLRCQAAVVVRLEEAGDELLTFASLRRRNGSRCGRRTIGVTRPRAALDRAPASAPLRRTLLLMAAIREPRDQEPVSHIGRRRVDFGRR
jgi:hypothetical protein